ncbi:hypothetical protein [Alkalihalobacillus sp. 1P02AB]|uniref:hypothetical protein n=1 Tax=Alkalihalobacillus sp. 1P02AB TaxID=3132260 RepID=UPI0039A5462A
MKPKANNLDAEGNQSPSMKPEASNLDAERESKPFNETKSQQFKANPQIKQPLNQIAQGLIYFKLFLHLGLYWDNAGPPAAP